MLDHPEDQGLDHGKMNCSSIWKVAERLALSVVAGSLLAACGSSGILPPKTDGEPSEDAAAAAAKTQQEFQEYWARQRQGGSSEPTPVAESAPEPVAEAPASEPQESRTTFSQWWAQKKQERAAAQASNASQPEAAPTPEPVAAAPEPEKKRRTFSQWWSDRKQQKGEPAEVAEAASPPAEDPQPVAEEPTKKNTLPIVTWWENRKKGKQGGDSDELAGIDLSGNFPTASPVTDWDGFVRSPYNDRFVDVKGVPSGTLVADPRYDLSERKFFIVP